MKSVPNANGELPALALAGFPALPKPGAGGFASEMNAATAANTVEGRMRFLDFHFFLP